MKSFYTSLSALLSHGELWFAFLCNQGIILPSRAIGIEFPNRKLDVNASQVVFTTGKLSDNFDTNRVGRAINFKHGGGEIAAVNVILYSFFPQQHHFVLSLK